MSDEELYQKILNAQQIIDQIIDQLSDEKHVLRSGLLSAHELGNDFRWAFQEQLTTSRFALQKIARPLYDLMANTDWFQDTDGLIAPSDVPRLLGLDEGDNLSTTTQRVQQYFQCYTSIEYNSRSYYLYHIQGASLRFRVLDIVSLVDCYDDITQVIQNTEPTRLADAISVPKAIPHDRLDSDVYVLGLIIEHHKAYLYQKNEAELRSVQKVGQAILDTLNGQMKNDTERLENLAQKLGELGKEHIVSARIVHDLRSIGNGHYRYRHGGRDIGLNINIIMKLYQKISDDIFQVARLG